MFWDEGKPQVDGGSPATDGAEPPSGDDDQLAELSLERLDREISSLSAHINAATCRWLLLVGEFDRREGYREHWFGLCSQWLSWRCGISARAAREHVRVARRLRELPVVRESFARGELSYSKVRVLTRIEGIEREDDLLNYARHATASQLERMTRAYTSAVSVARGDRAYARRHLTWNWDADGSLCVSARLPAEEGATFLRALEAARDELRARDREREAEDAEDSADDESANADASRNGPAGPPASQAVGTEGSRNGPAEPRGDAEPGDRARGPAEPPDAEHILLGRPPTNADALGLLAESLLANGVAERPAPERYQVCVHVEAESLVGAGDAPGSELERGPAIPAETARRLGCDASLVAIAERQGEALGVGRRTRAIPTPLRRALRARDKGCCFPGCANERFLDAHHIRHWAHGGETEPENLVLLCRHHHRAVHEGGFAIERLADGSLVFRRPDGEPIPHVPEPAGGDGAYVEQENARLGLEIDSETGMSLSRGEHMDLSLAVDGLLYMAPP